MKMKKIDLHLHTVKTFSDASFVFSMQTFQDYVTSAELDAVAVTNHDVFDLQQFIEIEKELNCVVFPGIEINLEKGHLLLISENQNLIDFKKKADRVSEKITNKSDFITVEELFDIYGDLSKYLLIPHYMKRPAIDIKKIGELKKYIFAGEVDSPKKFIRMSKDTEEITPVIFSDIRIKEGMKSFPSRQTYIDCGDVTLKSIKFSLRDKNKVSLSKSHGNSLFQVFDDGQMLSTGLNIVIGARSSGKTETLNKLSEECERVKYISQFSLVQRDDSTYEREFNENIARKKSDFSEKHLHPFKSVLDQILNIDLISNSRKVDEYLESLMKLADEAGKRDAFSKMTIFNECSFVISDDKSLNDLIKSVRLIIENIEFRQTIDKHVSIEKLKNLACELIEQLRIKNIEKNKKTLINEIILDVKSRLQLRSSSTQIKDFDLYKTLMDHKKVIKFNEIVNNLKTKKIIQEENIQGFKVICRQRAFTGSGEVKKISGLKIAFSEAFSMYEKPYNYLSSLKSNENITRSEIYKYFTCIEYEILNRDGFKVSGGERSEFRLLQEIKDAQEFDYLLIDEPESSFDNLFLKGEVNEILKDLSKTMPVVVVTHNSTVGASINADYIIYTSKKKIENKIIYKRYSGHPSSKKLTAIDGDEINNFEVTLNSLEAGHIAYTDRMTGYESLKD